MSRQEEVNKTIDEINEINTIAIELITTEEEKNNLILTTMLSALVQISETLAIICDKMKEGE